MHSIRVLAVVALLTITLVPGMAAASPGETLVVDSVSDDQAVLLEESDGDVVAERVVPIQRVEEDARHDGAVVEAHWGRYVYDEAETDRRQGDAQDRFDALSEDL